jgi:hypothetical protein
MDVIRLSKLWPSKRAAAPHLTGASLPFSISKPHWIAHVRILLSEDLYYPVCGL